MKVLKQEATAYFTSVDRMNSFLADPDAKLSDLAFHHKDMKIGGWIVAGQAIIEVQLVSQEENIKSAVETLQLEIKKVRAEAGREVTRIEGMISNLLCLEMAPATTPAPVEIFNINDDICKED